MTSFARPWLLVFAVAVPLVLAWLTARRLRSQRVPALVIAGRRAGAAVAPWVALVGVAAAWLVAAGPQRAAVRNLPSTGRDIVVLLDLSSSMAVGGPGRDALSDARRAVERLAEARRGDRIGLVGFGTRAAVVSPLTRDHATMVALASRLEPSVLGPRTAIGDGLAVALDLLRSSAPGSAGVVLVSDGESNAGAVEPLTAAEVAAERGVAVDTVAVRGGGGDDGPGRVNEPLLRRIADTTHGHFVRAREEGSLEGAFADLARLEPTERRSGVDVVLDDRSAVPARWAAALLLAAALVEALGRRAWA
ncbi:MAG TPA: VWA domain-containing protein [Thermoanaerobaculaceae bacterium]|nr:VWA domain-containing protein [Thermoanaerobaculaceae bacterium]